MAEAVLKESEISLNAVRYPILGSVQRGLSSNYPPKLVTGDYTKDSSPILSTLALSDHRGGIGLDIMEGQGDTDRSWYSTCWLRSKGRLVLPLLRNTATTLHPTNTTDVLAIVGFKGNVYAYFNAATDGIYRYSGTTWNNAGTPLLAVTGVTDGIAGTVGGTSYIIYCDGSNYYYSTDGSAWTTDTANATYLAIWDDKLWGIDAANGQLWYASTIGTETNDAVLVLENAAELQGLFVGPSATGEQIIYAITTSGLYAHDFDNGRFVKTNFQTTTVGATTKARACVWRGKIYYANTSSIYEYDPVGGTIRPIGPEQDGGLPTNYGTTVAALVATSNELVAAYYTGTSNNIGVLLAWDGKGWMNLREEAANEGHDVLSFGGITHYFLWWVHQTATTATVRYFSLPVDANGILRSSTNYGPSGTHDWPWFTAGQSEVTKVAVRLKAETLNPTTSETVIISYATDWVESFTAFATITTAGVTTFNFPNATTPTGTAFKSIRFRAALARGSTATNTPQLISLTLEYFKKLDPKYQFQVTLDMSEAYNERSPKEMRAALLTAQETATLVEFTYRDPAANTDATFYVQVRPQISSEETGYDESGKTQLLLVEV